MAQLGWGVRYTMSGGHERRAGLGFFFFQAEDGIRDVAVTGVQTCALPIFIFSDTVIERDARIERAIVDKYSRIGAGAKLGGPRGAGAGPGWLEGLVLVGKEDRKSVV